MSLKQHISIHISQNENCSNRQSIVFVNTDFFFFQFGGKYVIPLGTCKFKFRILQAIPLPS